MDVVDIILKFGRGGKGLEEKLTDYVWKRITNLIYMIPKRKKEVTNTVF